MKVNTRLGRVFVKVFPEDNQKKFQKQSVNCCRILSLGSKRNCGLID